MHEFTRAQNRAIHPFDNYVTTTLFSTSDHLKWKGFQVFFSWAMHGEAEHPSSTHARTHAHFYEVIDEGVDHQ